MTNLGPPARIETRRAVRLLAVTVVVIGTVLLAGLPSTARAAGDGGDNVLLYNVYEDNTAFCRRLIEQAREIETIEPVLPAGNALSNAYPRVPVTAVYLADKAPTDRDEAYRALNAEEWDKFFDPGNSPLDVGGPTTRIIVATDPRWQAYEAKCPGFLKFDWGDVWPIDFALYRVDIDNDGDEDHVLYREHMLTTEPTKFTLLDFIDFKACTTRRIKVARNEKVEIIRFEGKNFVLSNGISLKGISRPHSGPSRPDFETGDMLCTYSPIDKLIDFVDHGMTLKLGLPLHNWSDIGNRDAALADLPTPARAGGNGGDNVRDFRNPSENILLYHVYEDNPAFCRRLIEQARQVEFIEPVLPPPRVVWNRQDVGKIRNLGLFFADKAPSTKKRIYEAIQNEEWHEFFDEGNVPAHVDEPNTRVEIVISSQWRELNDKCPGFVLFGQEEFTGFAIPDRFALYRVDIDNDGTEEYILYQDFFPFNELRIIDFEACMARKIEGAHTYRPEIVRFEGQNYVLHYGGDSIILYRPRADSSGADHDSGDAVCAYSPIRKLTDYLDNGMALNRAPEYKRSNKP